MEEGQKSVVKVIVISEEETIPECTAYSMYPYHFQHIREEVVFEVGLLPDDLNSFMSAEIWTSCWSASVMQ